MPCEISHLHPPQPTKATPDPCHATRAAMWPSRHRGNPRVHAPLRSASAVIRPICMHARHRPAPAAPVTPPPHRAFPRPQRLVSR